MSNFDRKLRNSIKNDVEKCDKATKNTIANMMVDEMSFIEKHNEITSKRESLKKELDDLLNW